MPGARGSASVSLQGPLQVYGRGQGARGRRCALLRRAALPRAGRLPPGKPLPRPLGPAGFKAGNCYECQGTFNQCPQEAILSETGNWGSQRKAFHRIVLIGKDFQLNNLLVYSNCYSWK